MVMTVIVPKPNLTAKIQQGLEEALIDFFGGFSVYSGSGAWKDDNGDTCFEAHNRYDVVVNSFDALSLDRWDGLVESIRLLTKQGCVLTFNSGTEPEFNYGGNNE